jgi:hypothetical protein
MPPKKRVGKKPAGKKPAARVRPKNFTAEEDVFLCRAFVNVSQDPIKGNDQKSGDFWNNIRSTFMELYKAEAEVADEAMDRDVTSLQTRFRRHIHKDSQEFNGILKKEKETPKSGENEEDLLKRAVETYRDVHGRPYRFLDCLPVLQKMPKFALQEPDDDSVVSKSAMVNSSVYSASKMPRPIGCKAAKKRVHDSDQEGVQLTMGNKRVATLAAMAKSTHELAVAINNKQTKDHLVSMVKLCITMGDEEKKLYYFKKIEEAEAEEAMQKQSALSALLDEIVVVDAPTDNNSESDKSSSSDDDSVNSVLQAAL